MLENIKERFLRNQNAIIQKTGTALGLLVGFTVSVVLINLSDEGEFHDEEVATGFVTPTE